MKKSSIRIFLNPKCDRGLGLSKWRKINDMIHARIGAFEVEEIISPEEFICQLSKALKNGEKKLVAAGGDGTVNLLLNTFLKISNNQDITIGAIGLGSSNDFHKPFRKVAIINKVPVRIDFDYAFPCDVIRIDYEDSTGKMQTRFCLINASVGLTAEANAFFNWRSIYMKILQRLSVDMAILFAALRTIITYRNRSCRLTINRYEPEDYNITNLGIIKNPHFTGSLRYDTKIGMDDGMLGINLCYDMKLCARIAILIALARGRFKGRTKTKTWVARHFSVRSSRVFALEVDGEVVYTKNAQFNVMPKKVRCCI